MDYDQKPAALEALRHTVLPFFSYTYGTIPKLAQIAAKNPAKYAKWATVYYMLDELGTNMNVLPESYIDTAKDFATDNPMFGIPGMLNARITMPSFISDLLSPDNSNPMSLNAERLLPGGKFSLSEGGTGQIAGLPEMLQPGGGLAGAAIYSGLGINPLQGREIPEGERMNEFLRQVAPNWGGNIGEAMEAVTGIESYALKKERRAAGMAEQGLGRHSRIDDYSPATAGLSNTGVRLEQLDTTKMKRRLKSKYDNKIKDKKAMLKSLQREPVTSDRKAQHQRKINKLQAELRKLRERKRQVMMFGE